MCLQQQLIEGALSNKLKRCQFQTRVQEKRGQTACVQLSKRHGGRGFDKTRYRRNETAGSAGTTSASTLGHTSWTRCGLESRLKGNQNTKSVDLHQPRKSGTGIMRPRRPLRSPLCPCIRRLRQPHQRDWVSESSHCFGGRWLLASPQIPHLSRSGPADASNIAVCPRRGSTATSPI